MRAAVTFGLAALAWCAGVLPAVAGAVRDIPGGTRLTLKIFDLPDPAKVDPFSRAEAAVVRAFRERFPELVRERWAARWAADPARYGLHDWSRVEVDLEKLTGITVRGVEADLMAIAGGLAPDVLYVNFRKSDDYIRQGFLHPLDRPEDGYAAALPAGERDRRLPDAIRPVVVRGGPGGEHLWALPYGGAIGKVLLFRRDRFDEAGLRYPDADWTWDDLLAAARALSDPARGRYGLFLTRSRHEAGYFLSFLWSAGGEAMTWDPAQRDWRCVFDSPEAAMALDVYTRLSAERWTDRAGRPQRGYSAKDAGDPFVRWQRGEIAMMFEYLDERTLAGLNPELVGVAPVPRGPTGRRGSELNSRMMGLFAGIREPAVRDAAWEYIRFFDSDEALAIRTRVLVDGGLGPYLHPDQLRRAGYPELARLTPRGWADAWREALVSGHPEPYGRRSNQLYEYLTAPLQQAEQLALADRLPAGREARLAALQGLLRAACARANADRPGERPPGHHRVAAAALLAALLAAFAWMIRNVFRAFGGMVGPRDSLPVGGVAGSRARVRLWAGLLLAPALLSILIWQYVPLARGAAMAFYDYRLMGGSAWVGLDHFASVLFDRAWWAAVWNGLRYSTLVLALTFLPPIVLAVILQEIPRGRLLFRVLLYLPAMVGTLVVVVLWKQFYEPSSAGALNALWMRIPASGFLLGGLGLAAGAGALAARCFRHGARGAAWVCAVSAVLLLWTGVALAAPLLRAPGETWSHAAPQILSRLLAVRSEPVRWLSDPETALFACVLPMVWAGIGPGSLIYLAALKGVGEELYEAAELDGAGFLDKLLFVVAPTLRALIAINFVGAFIGAWYHATANILVLTGGTAGTEVAGLHIWYRAFTFLQFGPATAMAWMLGCLLLGFTLQQLRWLARVEFRPAGGRAP